MNRRDVLKAAGFGGLAIVANPFAWLSRKPLPEIPERYELPPVKLICDTWSWLCMAKTQCINSDRIFGRKPGTIMFSGSSGYRREDARWDVTLTFIYSSVGFDLRFYHPATGKTTTHAVYNRARLRPLLKMGKRVDA